MDINSCIKTEPTFLADYEFQLNLFGIKMTRLLIDSLCNSLYLFTSEVDFVRALLGTIFFISNVNILH